MAGGLRNGSAGPATGEGAALRLARLRAPPPRPPCPASRCCLSQHVQSGPHTHLPTAWPPQVCFPKGPEGVAAARHRFAGPPHGIEAAERAGRLALPGCAALRCVRRARRTCSAEHAVLRWRAHAGGACTAHASTALILLFPTHHHPGSLPVQVHDRLSGCRPNSADPRHRRGRAGADAAGADCGLRRRPRRRVALQRSTQRRVRTGAAWNRRRVENPPFPRREGWAGGG